MLKPLPGTLNGKSSPARVGARSPTVAASATCIVRGIMRVPVHL